MDRIDRRIVALLQENSRHSFREIGQQVGLSAPAVKRRVDRMEAEGVITGYGAAVDPEAFGLHTHAFVALFCEGRMSGSDVRKAVAGHPEVVGAYTIAGEASAILHVRAQDTKHLEEALERIRDVPGVLRTQTQIVLSTLLERMYTPAQGAGRQGRRAKRAR